MIAWILCGLIVALIAWFAWTEDSLGQGIIYIAAALLVTSCNRSDWWQESERARDTAAAARWKEEATPHVIREADGCKVYAFKGSDGYTHYFTRCAGSGTVTTERIGSKSCGKSCSKRTSETITTEGNDQ